jgi:hypothetical protein
MLVAYPRQRHEGDMRSDRSLAVRVVTREHGRQVIVAVDLNQRSTHRHGEITSPRGERSLPADPFEDDPIVGENAGRSMRSVFNRLAIALRASREHARVDSPMTLIRLFELIELPRSDHAEDVLTAVAGHQGGFDRACDDRTADERR